MNGKNPLKELRALGQAPWLDYIRRDLLDGGGLRRLIEEDGLCGVTSNPAIFEKAISGSELYAEDVRRLWDEGRNARDICDELMLRDVTRAADEFRPLWERTDGIDGYVSLEVNPHLARNTEATVEEARRLWKAASRPNVFIKVPATLEGLPAIKQLISEGVNVNVTLLFGLTRYRETAEAYLAGLAERAARGESLKVASVASFFLSRIDVMVDRMLEKLGGPALELRGLAAVASAREARRIYNEIFSGPGFRDLPPGKGARPQRLLWASTGTKNPEYSDVKYIEPLIGPDTVNTMPLKTLEAYRDHGRPEPRLDEDTDEPARTLARLHEAGIDIDDVARRLEEEGITKFTKPFDSLLDNLEKKGAAARGRK